MIPLKNRLLVLCLALCLLAGFFPVPVAEAADWRVWHTEELGRHVSTDRSWTIEFSRSVDPDSINERTVYVSTSFSGLRDLEQEPAIQRSVQGNRVTIRPQEAWQEGTTYYLFITDEVRDDSRRFFLEENLRKRFQVSDYTKLSSWITIIQEGERLHLPSSLSVEGQGEVKVASWTPSPPAAEDPPLPPGHYTYTARLEGLRYLPVYTLIVTEADPGLSFRLTNLTDTTASFIWNDPQRDRQTRPVILQRLRNAPSSAAWQVSRVAPALSWREEQARVEGLLPGMTYDFRLAMLRREEDVPRMVQATLPVTTDQISGAELYLTSFRRDEMVLAWEDLSTLYPEGELLLHLYERDHPSPDDPTDPMGRRRLAQVNLQPLSIHESRYVFRPGDHPLLSDPVLLDLDPDSSRRYDFQLSVRVNNEVAATSGWMPLPSHPPDYVGDYTIYHPGTFLSRMRIDGNLLLDAAIGNGRVWLDDVSVNGNLEVQGGGVSSIFLRHVDASGILQADKSFGRMRLIGSGTTALEVEAYSPLILDSRREDGQPAFHPVVLRNDPQQQDQRSLFSGVFNEMESHVDGHTLQFYEDSRVTGALKLRHPNSRAEIIRRADGQPLPADQQQDALADVINSLIQLEYEHEEVLEDAIGTPLADFIERLRNERPVRVLDHGVPVAMPTVTWTIPGYEPDQPGDYEAVGSFTFRGETYEIRVPVRIVTTLAQVTIEGEIQVGEELTALPSPEEAEATYQWQRSNDTGGFENIAGATQETYTLAVADYNRRIRVRAVGTGDYTGTVFSEPTDPVAAMPLESAGVNGVTVPETEGTPFELEALTPLPGDEAFYEVSGLRWLNDQGQPINISIETSFLPNTIYWAEVELTSLRGYTFPSGNGGLPASRLSVDEAISDITVLVGESVTGTGSGNLQVFTIRFRQTGEAQIREVELTGLKAPVKDESPVGLTDLRRVPANAPYTIESLVWYDGEVENSETPLLPGANFGAGQPYWAEIRLRSNAPDFRFDPDLGDAVTLNTGEVHSVSVVGTAPGNRLVLQVAFDPTDPREITEAGVTGLEAPEDGGTPVPVADPEDSEDPGVRTLPSHEGYTITKLEWIHENGDAAELDNDGNFVAGRTYHARVELTSQEPEWIFPAGGLTPVSRNQEDTANVGDPQPGSVEGGTVSGNRLVFVVEFPAIPPRPAPILQFPANQTVDGNVLLSVTPRTGQDSDYLTDWQENVQQITVNGDPLGSEDYRMDVTTDGAIQLRPDRGNTVLQTSGEWEVVVESLGYEEANASRMVNPGEAHRRESSVTPNTLTTGPNDAITVSLRDQYGNQTDGTIFLQARPTKNPDDPEITYEIFFGGSTFNLSSDSSPTNLGSAQSSDSEYRFDVFVPVNAEDGDSLRIIVALDAAFQNRVDGSPVRYNSN